MAGWLNACRVHPLLGDQLHGIMFAGLRMTLHAPRLRSQRHKSFGSACASASSERLWCLSSGMCAMPRSLSTPERIGCIFMLAWCKRQGRGLLFVCLGVDVGIWIGVA